MILNFEDDCPVNRFEDSFFYEQNYNSKLVNHYNHDVYDKKINNFNLKHEFEDEEHIQQILNSHHNSSIFQLSFNLNRPIEIIDKSGSVTGSNIAKKVICPSNAAKKALMKKTIIKMFNEQTSKSNDNNLTKMNQILKFNKNEFRHSYFEPNCLQYWDPNESLNRNFQNISNQINPKHFNNSLFNNNKTNNLLINNSSVVKKHTISEQSTTKSIRNNSNCFQKHSLHEKKIGEKDKELLDRMQHLCNFECVSLSKGQGETKFTYLNEFDLANVEENFTFCSSRKKRILQKSLMSVDNDNLKLNNQKSIDLNNICQANLLNFLQSKNNKSFNIPLINKMPINNNHINFSTNNIINMNSDAQLNTDYSSYNSRTENSPFKFKKRIVAKYLDEQKTLTLKSNDLNDPNFSFNNSNVLHSNIVLSKELTLNRKEKPNQRESQIWPERHKKIKRCPHVWQFCADLLDDETFNPSIIKWLNKEKGVFKIVKPDQVAELWGAQKNRKSDKKMNYEKMARGMRYSRREGFFKKLDKEKNKPNEYGKQLVFQFSDKVVKNFDWKWSFSKKD